jgi:hypothetical protein
MANNGQLTSSLESSLTAEDAEVAEDNNKQRESRVKEAETTTDILPPRHQGTKGAEDNSKASEPWVRNRRRRTWQTGVPAFSLTPSSLS